MKNTRAARLRNALIGAGLLLWIIPATAENVQKDIRVIPEEKHDVSLPLRELARNTGPASVNGVMIEKEEHRAPKGFFRAVPGIDPAVQDEYLPKLPTTSLLSFDGVTGQQGGAVPPDTNGSVGGTQFVEIVNVVYQVYDKTTGQPLLPQPVQINTIWNGFGGLCESTNGGDPVVLWDKLAQRWLVTQLAYNNRLTKNFLCLAVSTSADATGSYNRYAFNMGGNLPDYPKYAVWPDAYYGTHNLYSSNGFLGAEPCAWDRKAMLAGGKATMICIKPDPANFGFLPSDLDGATLPPKGAPNHYLELGNLTNQLKEFDFHVDFVNPKSSRFKGPRVISVPNYILLCNDGGNFACVPQPNPGEKVDSLSGLLMFRLAYRRFRNHDSMVVAHAVRPGKGSTATVATRWYELRSTGGKFSLYQSGTFQSKTDNLWMASIAMDKQGDIAMGMSADSSTRLDTSIWYTGRVPSDPLGKMETPTVVVKGSAVQVNGGNRWGDYSSMSVDPSDDCTFWFSEEYYNKKNGGAKSSDWTTHMISFKFDSCH
ncbi:MAG TPA: hypothetical protein VN948_19480 [Terriglobales bacterium]|nr:hypothetical protein [Terriglobales bacterium]